MINVSKGLHSKLCNILRGILTNIIFVPTKMFSISFILNIILLIKPYLNHKDFIIYGVITTTTLSKNNSTKSKMPFMFISTAK